MGILIAMGITTGKPDQTIFLRFEDDLSSSRRYSEPFSCPTLLTEARALKVIGLFVRVIWSLELRPSYLVYFRLPLLDFCSYFALELLL